MHNSRDCGTMIRDYFTKFIFYTIYVHNGAIFFTNMDYRSAKLHIAIAVVYIKPRDGGTWYNIGDISLDRCVTRKLCYESSCTYEYTLFYSCLT